MTHDKIPEPSHNGTHPARDHDIDRGGQVVGRSKFDLGVGNGFFPSEDIPWSYGECRVTAMARDPDWLYVYWEISDEAIEQSRRKIAKGNHDAWCCLRVYDTSGRVFDGSNSLSYFDVAIERTSRDWFVHVGKPHSSCHVEVGVKSRQGDFQPIARSGRTDFPRKRPAEDVSVEWLTVEDAGPVAQPPPVAAPYVSRYDGPVPEVEPLVQPLPLPQTHQRHAVPYRVLVDQHTLRQETWRQTWTERRSFAWSTRVSHRFEGAYHRWSIPWLSEPWRTEWQGDDRAFEWVRPLHQLTWSERQHADDWEMTQLAPYPGDSAAPGRVLVRFLGDHGAIEGFSRSQAGAWEVTIHGWSFGDPKRRVLGTWLLHWSQPQASITARWELSAERIWFDGFEREHVMIGASERELTIEAGASELWALGAAEFLSMGASELLALGGSEQLWLGASEKRLAGASELVSGWSLAWLGASELSLEMTSALLVQGASERMAFGASEAWAVGASERWQESAFTEASSELLSSERFLGASEQMGKVEWVTLGELIGASELLGASEQWGASDQLLTELGGASEAFSGILEQLVGPSDHLAGSSDHLVGPGDLLAGELLALGGASQPVVTTDSGLQLDDERWTPLGASEEVAEATYPSSLEADEDDSEKEGG